MGLPLYMDDIHSRDYITSEDTKSVFARIKEHEIREAVALLEQYGWKCIPPNVCDDPL